MVDLEVGANLFSHGYWLKKNLSLKLLRRQDVQDGMKIDQVAGGQLIELVFLGITPLIEMGGYSDRMLSTGSGNAARRDCSPTVSQAATNPMSAAPTKYIQVI